MAKVLLIDDSIILAETTFKVQNLQVEGSIFIAFEFGAFRNILSEIDKIYIK